MEPRGGRTAGSDFDARLTENYTWGGRARWGAGGALNPQPALAGLNSPSRSGASGLAAIRGVDGRVPRGGERRTRSGPEGSSRKPTSLGDVGKPDRSQRPSTSWSVVIDKGCTANSASGRLARKRAGRFALWGSWFEERWRSRRRPSPDPSPRTAPTPTAAQRAHGPLRWERVLLSSCERLGGLGAACPVATSPCQRAPRERGASPRDLSRGWDSAADSAVLRVRCQAANRMAATMRTTTQATSQIGAPNESGLICNARMAKKKRPAPKSQRPIIDQWRTALACRSSRAMSWPPGPAR